MAPELACKRSRYVAAPVDLEIYLFLPPKKRACRSALFSKEVIEKLRELFNTLFSTRENVEKSLLDRMPAELREKVEVYLGDAHKPNAGDTNAGNTSSNQH